MELIDKIQRQLDANHYVEAEDIQKLIDIVKERRNKTVSSIRDDLRLVRANRDDNKTILEAYSEYIYWLLNRNSYEN